jgi:predicted metal-binding protein
MSRKFLVTIVLILFLLPFVSWYYLQSGLEWRKKAQDIMSGTSPFPSGEFLMANGRIFNTDSLEYYVSIVSFVPCSGEDHNQKEVLDVIYKQFKDTNKAKIIQLDSCKTNTPTVGLTGTRNWYILPCSDSTDLYKALLAEWPEGKPFALVDRKGTIRSYYAIGSHDEKRVLVEHMSLLLPRDRQEKVELKRGEKK